MRLGNKTIPWLFATTLLFLVGDGLLISQLYSNTAILSVLVAVAAGLVGFVQILITAYRENLKARWEAVQSYHSEIDGETLVAARAAIHNGESPGDQSARLFLNFYEKWGRLVDMEYLPLEIFDGPSGEMVSNTLLPLESTIQTRRNANRRYAEAYLNLVGKILKAGYISDNPKRRDIAACLNRLQ